MPANDRERSAIVDPTAVGGQGESPNSSRKERACSDVWRISPNPIGIGTGLENRLSPQAPNVVSYPFCRRTIERVPDSRAMEATIARGCPSSSFRPDPSYSSSLPSQSPGPELGFVSQFSHRRPWLRLQTDRSTHRSSFPSQLPRPEPRFVSQFSHRRPGLNLRTARWPLHSSLPSQSPRPEPRFVSQFSHRRPGLKLRTDRWPLHSSLQSHLPRPEIGFGSQFFASTAGAEGPKRSLAAPLVIAVPFAKI